LHALAEGLAIFKGGVLMVSQVQYLMEASVEDLGRWLCRQLD
jgi:hypothetical protein